MSIETPAPIPLSPERDLPICTQEAARVAGLDVAPTPVELAAIAESIVRTWGDRTAEPEDLAASTADTGAQLARAVPLLLAERDELRTSFDTAIKGFNASAMEITRLRERVAELEARPTTDDVVAWLVKKAREYRHPTAPERQESPADVLARMADKVSRGAIRPAPEKKVEPEPTECVTEYGIRIPDGRVLEARSGRGNDYLDQAARDEIAGRLTRYRDMWPGAVMVQRTVTCGPWSVERAAVLRDAHRTEVLREADKADDRTT